MVIDMKRPKPIIKFNGGNPVAICNRCFTMMCYVDCRKDECVILNIVLDTISTPIGKTPPSYCDNCEKLLNYSINE